MDASSLSKLIVDCWSTVVPRRGNHSFTIACLGCLVLFAGRGSQRRVEVALGSTDPTHPQPTTSFPHTPTSPIMASKAAYKRVRTFDCSMCRIYGAEIGSLQLSKEYVAMQREPPPFVWAAPDEKDILSCTLPHLLSL